MSTYRIVMGGGTLTVTCRKALPSKEIGWPDPSATIGSRSGQCTSVLGPTTVDDAVEAIVASTPDVGQFCH